MELTNINNLLPVVNLPLYYKHNTILDQLIYAEQTLETKSRFEKYRIKIVHYRQLALLLVLAIKGKIFSSDVITFALDREIAEAIKKYDPFIERVETYNYEKDAKDISSLKYVLNSKYWLRRELGRYAQNEDNYKVISDAYEYIIDKLLAAAGSDESNKRRLCKEYIMFDVMNDLFLNQYGGIIRLIVHIYDRLHELLATNYNFLHQNAKCIMNYCYTLRKEPADKQKKTMLRAQELAVISKSMVEQLYDETKHEHLLISIAHIQFTIASIRSCLCILQNYTADIEEFQSTIDIVSQALTSPYNFEYQPGRRASQRINEFIKAVYIMIKDRSLNLSKEHNTKALELMNRISFGNVRV